MDKLEIINKHYLYVGKGTYIARKTYIEAMKMVHNNNQLILNDTFCNRIEPSNVAESPVKYNGSFVDTIPQ